MNLELIFKRIRHFLAAGTVYQATQRLRHPLDTCFGQILQSSQNVLSKLVWPGRKIGVVRLHRLSVPVLTTDPSARVIGLLVASRSNACSMYSVVNFFKSISRFCQMLDSSFGHFDIEVL